MELLQAVSLSLSALPEPVVTRYRLSVILHELYRSKKFAGQALERLQKDQASKEDYLRLTGQLEASGILSEHPDFGSKAYRLFGRSNGSPEEVACSLDPFCYLSHLSAMAHHGISDRIPAKLFLSSPSPARWKIEAQAKMEKDLGGDLASYIESGMPVLERLKIIKIGRTEVHRFHSVHWGAYKNVRDSVLRVATIGRTFLDMLRNPELCGGMRHVMDTFREHAAVYLALIIGEIDRHGAPIDKVRAGYLIEEYLEIKDPSVEKWVSFAQRGGSRKLDASGDYAPKWSEKWCLSLNID